MSTVAPFHPRKVDVVDQHVDVGRIDRDQKSQKPPGRSPAERRHQLEVFRREAVGDLTSLVQ